MFQHVSSKAPKVDTRRALVLLNMQNDAFGAGDLPMSKTLDMADRAKGIIPPFRKLGDIIWVRTEFLTEQPVKPLRGESSINPAGKLGLVNYYSTSRERARKRKLGTNGQVIDVVTDPYEMDDYDDSIDDYLARHKEGPPPAVFQPGTKGAQIKDDLQPYIDPAADLVMVKHHHSAFDSSPLLMYLRMKFITHVYLCGYLSNVSVYYTAADAVRHGFEVSVVEDVLGYRSEARHIEAMRKMADFLGVSGIDSEEISQEAASVSAAPPDTEEPVFTGPGMEGIAPPNRLTSSLKPAPPPPPPPLFSDNPGRPTSSSATAASKTSSPRIKLRKGSDDAAERSSPSNGERSPEIGKRDGKEGERDPNRRYGPDDTIGEGDSKIMFDALSTELSEEAFRLVEEEANWQVMHHLRGEVPRRVAVQGEVSSDGSFPVYRHPADDSPPLEDFSKAVRQIRDELQTMLKQPFNHVLIQLYRSGHDNISEHSDKTLDIVRGSSIVNLSLGAQRNMVLRTKKPPKGKRDPNVNNLRQTQKIPMPHGSIFVLGSRTNAKWLHAVRPDKRLENEKLEAEKAYDGVRISLTFRHIGTFVNSDSKRIWGQGARSKYRATAGEISATNCSEMEAMIIAFGAENQQIDFDWDSAYGRGFDVLNLVALRSTLFLCGDELANLRVKMCVLNSGLECRITTDKPETFDRKSASASNRRTIFALSGDEAPVLREVDPTFSEVIGDLAILFYLNKLYIPTSEGDEDEPPSSAKGKAPATTVRAPKGRLKQLTSNVYARITQANELLFLWQEMCGRPLSSSTRATHQVRRVTGVRLAPLMDSSPLEAFEDELEVWEEYADETEFIAGDVYAIVDCAFWPVLDDIVRRWSNWSERRYPNLADYWRKVGALESTRRAILERGEATREDVDMRGS